MKTKNNKPIIFSDYTSTNEALPAKDTFVMAQVDFDNGSTSMVICKIGDNNTFLYGTKRLKPLPEEGHVTAWKYI